MSATVPTRTKLRHRPRVLAVLVVIIASAGLVLAIWGPAIASGICQDYQGLLSSVQGLKTVQSAPTPYDEQVALIEAVDTPGLETNVTASSSSDVQGYGPGFLLNGLSSAGYWYQTGVTFNWGQGTSGHATAPGFYYSVLSPSGSVLSIGLERVQVNSRDTVQLILTIQGGTVSMGLHDSATCVAVEESFSAYGASSFQSTGTPTSTGFFSGLLTEWYHAVPYQGPTGNATYTIPGASSSAAEIGVDEIAPTSESQNGFQSFTDINLADQSPQSGSYMGATAIVDGIHFQTG
jgi:hypothetical protein